jgi:hypothetical protein
MGQRIGRVINKKEEGICRKEQEIKEGCGFQ